MGLGAAWSGGRYPCTWQANARTFYDSVIPRTRQCQAGSEGNNLASSEKVCHSCSEASASVCAQFVLLSPDHVIQ